MSLFPTPLLDSDVAIASIQSTQLLIQVPNKLAVAGWPMQQSAHNGRQQGALAPLADLGLPELGLLL
jgi:hypothetical protein